MHQLFLSHPCCLAAQLLLSFVIQRLCVALSQMVSYKIVRADNGDAWVEVSFAVSWC